MTLTAMIASDPPKSRRFRRIVPLAVLIGLFGMILGPGLVLQAACQGGHDPISQISQIDPLVQQLANGPRRGFGT